MKSIRTTRHLRFLSVLSLLVCSFALVIVNDALAVSRAGALFLRIPVGARAAAMGESYIAIADDATATHWNPAGLGSAPLSGSWLNFEVPLKYRPLKAFAAVKASGGSLGQQLWAISDSGVIVNDGSEWRDYTLYQAEVEETVENIVRKYTQANNDSVIAQMMALVGDRNNSIPRSAIAEVEAKTMALLPTDAAKREEFANGFVTLHKAYDKLLVNWERFAELRNLVSNRQGTALSGGDLEKATFALEKSVRRYVPEEIKLPFAMVFTSSPTMMIGEGPTLWVGSEDGLYRHANGQWNVFRSGGEKKTVSLPSSEITTLATHGSLLYVGTANGLVAHFGLSWEPVGIKEGLPTGRINGVAYSSSTNGWAIVDGEVFQFDGTSWKNYSELKAGIDQSVATIAGGFAIYGTDAERAKYFEKVKALNPELGADSKLTLGQVVKSPIVAEIKGDITALCATDKVLWVGTAQGALSFNGSGWTRYGYSELTTTRATTVTDIALDIAKGDSAQALLVASKIREQNDLAFDTIDSGRTIWVYRNIAGARVNDISEVSGVVFITTAQGVLTAKDGSLSRFDESGLSSVGTVAVDEVGGNLWFATESRVESLRNASRYLSLVYAQWLPELADDLFVSHIAYVAPVKGVGTMGLSFNYLSYGSILRMDANQNSNGTESPFEFALGLSYGLPVNNSSSVGVTLRGLWSHLANAGAGSEQGKGNATAIAFDAGFLSHLTDRLSFGAALTNFGTKLTYIDAQQADNLPTNIGVGLAFTAAKSELIRVLLTSDVNSQVIVEKRFEPVFNVGGEFSYAELFAIRAGFLRDEAGARNSLSLGVGLTLKSQRLDFEYHPSTGDNNVFANTLIASASLKF